METSIIINILAVSLLVLLVALALAVIISIVTVAFNLPKPREEKYRNPRQIRIICDQFYQLNKKLTDELNAVKKQRGELTNK